MEYYPSRKNKQTTDTYLTWMNCKNTTLSERSTQDTICCMAPCR